LRSFSPRATLQATIFSSRVLFAWNKKVYTKDSVINSSINAFASGATE
jgi:hypothetical protein